MIRVNLVGTGNLGWNLAQALQDANGVELVQVVDRSERLKDLQGLNRIETLETMNPADICLLAVRDSDIAGLVPQLRQFDMMIAHCSGATPLSELDGLKRAGVWYPLQTFSKDLRAPLKNITVALESNDDDDLELLSGLALALHANPIRVDSAQRRVLHLSAVLVNNFVNHLFTLGKTELDQVGLSFDLLLPLIQETVRKASLNGPEDSQTGPAVRNDHETIQKHLDLLSDPKTRELYIQLTQSILQRHGKEL
ncbi:Rossmann-like and DUF2520 domain-containing protein [Aureitalea marina]|uniref:DUF2520 domain-containing protein n=1 Tax=Aureitalea marina TaxID=930804 RepID=A0A2S7KPI8_9FLAO|nr:Rossmann-like and DUF2520 domain-containing protein [Aureitalea marina]PQB04520.1 hypothetical protein BST85_06105 [Aureitalea marina]